MKCYQKLKEYDRILWYYKWWLYDNDSCIFGLFYFVILNVDFLYWNYFENYNLEIMYWWIKLLKDFDYLIV
jgi:hypothetical protein